MITGSYNFTHSAQARNAENLLILRGRIRHWQALISKTGSIIATAGSAISGKWHDGTGMMANGITSLFSEFWRDLQQPDLLWQAAVLVLCLTLAFC